MAASPPRRRDSPPALPDELVEVILLRLPPDEPACLLRSSLVCKAWGCAASRRGFRRRLHELHRTPPVLGFLHNWDYKRIPRFVPTIPSSFSLAAPDHRSWKAMDCRHGRALFLSKANDNLELLLWEPITGAQHRVPVPAAIKNKFPAAAVFCAAHGCDHRDCLGGPFGVVFIFSVEQDTEEDIDDEQYVLSASIYSSETGAWGELTSMRSELTMDFNSRPYFYSCVLVGSSLLYFMSEQYGLILEYDLARHVLNEIDAPGTESTYIDVCIDRFKLMLTEDGGLCVSEGLGSHLKLWTREATNNTDVRWVVSRVIFLQNSLPYDALLNATNLVRVLAFAEEANIIFVKTAVGIFTIELQSEHARRVYDTYCLYALIPVVSFYTPVPRGEHQNLLAPMPNEKTGGEEGGEEDKTVYQAHKQPFEKGSSAIKEGDFVNTFKCVSHDLNIRVPCHGEGASSPNKELVNGTASIDDDGNSTTFNSNVEGAPPSEKDLKGGISKQQQEEEKKRQRKEKK